MKYDRIFVGLSMSYFLIAGIALGETPYERTSAYVPMQDGVRLAVDVYLPADRDPAARLPALLELTRYWRGFENPQTGESAPLQEGLDLFFLEHGYALVKVDVRGSGASFGTRPIEYGPQEVRDGRAIVAWVVSREWSSGKVGAYGVSYAGTTAELLAASGHPAVKAVIPGWSDFDAFRSPARPYGLMATGFIGQWSQYVGLLDANDAAVGAHVRRVDSDADGALRAAAVREHTANPDVLEAVKAADFRDRRIGGGYSLADASSLYWQRQIEASGVAMLVFASWLDAGTAGGALQRFREYSNPQHLVILASSHGGSAHASPYVVGNEPVEPIPSGRELAEMHLRFFDHHLKGTDNGVDGDPAIRYFNLGEERLLETDVWPPRGAGLERRYLAADGVLSPDVPKGGGDRYDVDFSVSTGAANRWLTQMGEPVLGLDDRGAQDDKMLVYTSPPLSEDLQLTGTPVVSLHVTSNRDDGAFLVYLEDVDPSGRSRYVTEGGLRAVHRQWTQDPDRDRTLPRRSFAEADALPLVPGEPAKLVFELWPTSVLIRRGHRVRVALAGADAAIFDRVPESGPVKLELLRGEHSWIDLPVVEAVE